MKKGDMYEAVVETIDFPNKGILHVDGERVIVKNAIPGQKVRFVVNKKRKGIFHPFLLKIFPTQKDAEAAFVASGVFASLTSVTP